MEKKTNQVKLTPRVQLLTFKVIFGILATISGLTFLSASVGNVGGAINWFFVKWIIALVVGLPTLICLGWILHLLPERYDVKAYLNHYTKCINNELSNSKIPDHLVTKIQGHLKYINSMAIMLSKTPDDIEKMESEISDSEAKIRAVNRASSAAIGYGAGKKTGM